MNRIDDGPKAYRGAALKVAIQQDALYLLSVEHDRERHDFLLLAMKQQQPEPAADAPPLSNDDRAARMRERLEAARQTQHAPSRGEPGRE